MRTFALALALLASAPAMAASPSQPLFPMEKFVVDARGGKTIPFVVDVDFSRSKSFGGGQPHLLMTVLEPTMQVTSFQSRPLKPGEKVHWEGKIPAQGNYVIHIFNDSRMTTYSGKVGNKITLRVTGNASGDWSGDGSCDPKKPQKADACLSDSFSF